MANLQELIWYAVPMSKPLLQLLFFGLLAANGLAFVECEVEGEIKFSPAGELVFRSIIRNTTAHAVVVPEAELPWKFREKLVVRVIYPEVNLLDRSENYEQLLQGVPNAQITIAPSQSIEGTLELNEISRSLAARAVANREILIVWYHYYGWTTNAPRLVTGMCRVYRGKVDNFKAEPKTPGLAPSR